MEVKESLSVYDCSFLLPALLCRVHSSLLNTALKLHCYRVMLKMLLWAIQRGERDKEGEIHQSGSGMVPHKILLNVFPQSSQGCVTLKLCLMS